MGKETDMALPLDQRLTTAAGLPDASTAGESGLSIVVILTSLGGTVAALKKAAALAEGLGGEITLVAVQVVPYPLPLTSRPVALGFHEKRLQEIAAGSPVEI